MSIPVGTGDGLESEVSRQDRGAADVSMSAIVGNLIKTHGVPNKVSSSRFTKQMAQIDALCGAKSKEQKEAVKNTITYLAVVHGCGPNVKWEEIPCEPEGCKSVMMNEIVDGVITRAYHRRFMTNFSARAERMFDASPELQNVLMPRAVRNGLSVTDTKSVIDFLDSSSGVAPSVISNRVMSKYSAVARANLNGPSSVEKSSRGAARDMHSYEHGGDTDSLGGL